MSLNRTLNLRDVREWEYVDYSNFFWNTIFEIIFDLSEDIML
jgi:hypothetical protein